MKNIFRMIRDSRFTYEPLVEIRIFRDALLYNLHTFQRVYSNYQVAPVLKANAYGHGIIAVGTILKNEHIPFLVVDSYHEALVLRNEKMKTPILIIGYTNIHNILTNKLLDIAYTVTSFHQLELLAQTRIQNIAIHIKFDTGMHRQGVEPERLDAVIALCQKNPHIHVEGICSHFADADGEDVSFSHAQVTTWNMLVKKWKDIFPHTRYFHISATAGKRFTNVDANVLRLGRGFYGYDIAPIANLGLQPALEMKTMITGVKCITQGDKVGYNGTFEAPSDMVIATIPVGYNEGIDRRLSNKGYVVVSGVECPIVGRVSMNITTIDVSGVPDAKEGDAVIVIGRDTTKKNSLLEIARITGTIGHEILVHISPNLRRTVV